MARRFRDRRRPAGRGRVHRTVRRRLLVLCEGQVTEPGYIRGLERWLKSATVEVVIPKIHGVPRTLVAEAVERKRDAKTRAKRERDPFLDYDEVWCVFDVDAHPKLGEARELARAHDIHLAISNPCFELWLLLHFRESPGARHRHDVQRLVGSYLEGYAKRVSFPLLGPGLDDACRRAARMEQEAKRDGEAGRNPSTGVHRLVASIRP
ncbi:MAG: RloB family protein [Acidobacteriota bacterium]